MSLQVALQKKKEKEYSLEKLNKNKTKKACGILHKKVCYPSNLTS